ncbi:MAG: type II toxin-antitoxin system HipA family toxin [Pseudomarimonas sp.]
MTDVLRYVFAHLPGEREAVPAGALTLVEEGRETLASRFAYGRNYLARPKRIPVDPKSLPLDASARRTTITPANGLVLFGALRDASPDLWGRRVIENKLRAPPDSLPESAYLDHAGDNRTGALDVRTAVNARAMPGPLPGSVDLDHLVQAADRIADGEPVPAHLEMIFLGAPTLGGARPKSAIRHDGRQWVAKFPARNDGFNVPVIERASLELARQAGIQVPRTQHVKLGDGRDVMLIERFDRGDEAEGYPKTHMVSALTMLGLHELDRNASYVDLCRVIEQFGVSGQIQADRTELYRRMVFNILITNDDDHLRNHAFLYDATGGGWRLSPLYDVVPRPMLGTERFLAISIGAQGRLATLDNALSQCAQFGLSKPAAVEIITSIVAVVRSWRVAFEALGVATRECDRVATAFRRAADIGMKQVEAARP